MQNVYVLRFIRINGCQVHAIHSISILLSAAVWKISNAITTFQTCTNAANYEKISPYHPIRTAVCVRLVRSMGTEKRAFPVGNYQQRHAHTHTHTNQNIPKIASSHPRQRSGRNFGLPFDALSFEADAFDERVHLGTLRGWMGIRRKVDANTDTLRCDRCACVAVAFPLAQLQHPTKTNK